MKTSDPGADERRLRPSPSTNGSNRVRDDVPETEMAGSIAERGILGTCHVLCQKSPLTFTLASALCLLTQINMGVFMISQITFLEKEFGFSSFQTGQVMSAAEIGYLCFVLLSGHLASRLHVPRLMSLTALIFGIVSILSGLPHFLFSGSSSSEGRHRNSSVVSAADIPPAFCWTGREEGEEDRCQAMTSLQNSTISEAGDSTEVVFSVRAYPVYIFLIVCQLIRGATRAFCFPLFAEYIETNAKKTDTGFYMGIVASIAMLGPAIAFLGGGAISKLHVSLQPTDLTPTHPDWVGAWWLGFFIFGFLAAVAPVFLCRFPRQLGPPSPPPVLPLSSSSSSVGCENGQHKAAMEVRTHKLACSVVIAQGVVELKGFLMSLVSLVTNPVYVFLVLASCMMGFAMNGTYLFLPKYLQNQFQLPAWKANYIMGGGELTVGTSGFLVSGWLTRRFKLLRSSVYKMLMVGTLASALLVVAVMFLGCPQPTLIGEPGSMHKWDSNCSVSCVCPEEVFPVCDEEIGETYFSPCHAGCSDLQDGVYMNCSCAASGRMYPGECIAECDSVYYYSAIFFVLLFVLSVGGPLNYLVVVRSVPTPKTGLAIGLSGFITGIAAFLVGPMVFGGLIDSFCDHWKRPCGVQGQCSVYDKDRFRVQMHSYSAVSMGLGGVCQFLSFLLFVCCPRLYPATDGDGAAAIKNGDKKSEKAGGDKAITREPHHLPLPEHPDVMLLMEGSDTPGAGDPSPPAIDGPGEDAVELLPLKDLPQQ